MSWNIVELDESRYKKFDSPTVGNVLSKFAGSHEIISGKVKSRAHDIHMRALQRHDGAWDVFGERTAWDDSVQGRWKLAEAVPLKTVEQFENAFKAEIERQDEQLREMHAKARKAECHIRDGWHDDFQPSPEFHDTIENLKTAAAPKGDPRPDALTS